VVERHVTHITVPGALEIAVALKAMADSDDFDALIAIGCVIRGETYHFELVANESGAGVTRVALDARLPVANAILTVENPLQAHARIEEKGREAARVAVEMALFGPGDRRQSKHAKAAPQGFSSHSLSFLAAVPR